MCAASPAEEEPPVLHGLDHGNTHRRDAFSRISPVFSVQPSSSNRRASSSQITARRATRRDPRPSCTGGRARRRRRAHAVQREATFVVGVDQLVVRGGAAAGSSQAKDSRARTPVKARTGCCRGRRRESRRSLRRSRGASSTSSPAWRPWINPLADLHVADLEAQGAAGVQPRRDQVLDVLLAVDGDPAAAGEGDGKSMRWRSPEELELDPVVDESLPPKPLPPRSR